MGQILLKVCSFGYVAGYRRLIAPKLENPPEPFVRRLSQDWETEVSSRQAIKREGVFGYLFALCPFRLTRTPETYPVSYGVKLGGDFYVDSICRSCFSPAKLAVRKLR